MERMYPNWKLWAIASVYAGGCYVVGTIFFNRKIEDIVGKCSGKARNKKW